MTLIQAFILGVIQGLTEFLPISSSGHLVVAQQLFGFTEPPVFFDVVIHVATLLAVFIFFAHDIRTLNKKLLFALAIASIPTAIIGLLLNPYADFMFQSLPLTVIGFAITSVLLLSLKNIKPKKGHKTVGLPTAFIIGIAQGISIIPSISRSGATIGTALLKGVDSKQAFSFSFLLSIPAIIGATILEFSAISQLPDISSLIVGFITAAITGFLSLAFLRRVLIHHHFYRFGIYTSVVTLALLIRLFR